MRSKTQDKNTSAASTPRDGFILLDLVVAMTVLAAAVTLGALSVTQVYSERKILLHRTIASQALENAICRMESSPLGWASQEAVEKMELELWSASQLPDGELRVVVGETDVRGLRKITVSVVWRDLSIERRQRAVLWRGNRDGERP